MSAAPALLFAQSIVSIDECTRADANDLLTEWAHPLGPCNRPFRTENWTLTVRGEPVAVMVTAGIVSPTVEQHRRTECIELARIARAPEADWVLRPALRIWRAVLALEWQGWSPIRAAYSYALPGTPGELYRFDGWERIGERRPARVGATSGWSKPSKADAIADGKKTLWRWTYLSDEPATTVDAAIGPEGER